jgi:hypothetical protein
MANVIIGNYQPTIVYTSSITNTFSVIWKLTRAMKKAGWTYKSSGNGSSKDTTGVASNDLWGGNTDPNTDTYSSFAAITTGSQSLPTATLNTTTNPQTAGFPTSGTILVATSTNGWQTVSYTGITTSSFTGCTGGTGTVPASSAVGSAAINMDLVTGWWNAQGPDTLKIPISTAQVDGYGGAFIRGENVTQSVTGAQGELLGYLFDTTQLTGYLVVAPRVDGYSPGNPHGWDSTHTITGSISQATITPSSTVLEFVREVVFWKQNVPASGTTYYQCVDGYNETANRYSVLAASTGCTATVAPGGGGTSNSFPATGSFVIQGTGGSQSPSNWFQGANAQMGRAAFMATNATYSNGSSADGSFTVALGSPTTNSGAFIGYVFTRVDAQEDGDVDPYVWYTPSNQTLYTPTRTADTSTFFASGCDFWQPQNVSISNNFFKFWRRRGLGGTLDAFQTGTFGLVTGAASATVVLSQNVGDREKLANSFTDTYVLEDVWCISYQAFAKTRKGVCRWLKAVQGGSGCDLYGGKIWLQLGNANTTQTYGFVSGPWDGATVQTQS